MFEDRPGEFIKQWLGAVVQKAARLPVSADDAVSLDKAVRDGEPEIAGLMYSHEEADLPRAGVLSLIALNQRASIRRLFRRRNVLWSAYPFLGDGAVLEAVVTEIGLHPNRVEARLRLSLDAGPALSAFDTLFFQRRARYRADRPYLLSLAALAYEFGPAIETETVIDDPAAIRRLRGAETWARTHDGRWSAETDGERVLEQWTPRSPEDLEPIRIMMGRAAYWMSASSGPADDAAFQGEVVAVEPAYASLLGTTLWRVDVTVMRPYDREIALPIYVAERAFKTEWRPTVGEYVEGTAWLQCRLVDAGSPSP